MDSFASDVAGYVDVVVGADVSGATATSRVDVVGVSHVGYVNAIGSEDELPIRA